MKKTEKNFEMQKYLRQHNIYETVPLGVDVRAMCRYAERKQIPLDRIPETDLLQFQKR